MPPATAPRREPDDYFHRSRQPLHILVFLLPLVVLYEIGAAWYLSGDAATIAEDIRAHRLLADFFKAFGVGGVYLPGIALVVVLLMWQVLARHPWRVRRSTLGGMLLESIVWTFPLLVLAQMIAAPAQASAETAGAPPLAALAQAPAASPPGGLDDLSLPARATIAIGAGLYEELLFRLVAIGFLHLLLADALGVPGRWADVLAIAGAALAFALYHEDHANVVFYTLAGLYFGGLFIFRGFGVAVAVHAIYDLVALLL
jgi:membrane protease YdiL (CAAX protease family)